MKSSSVISGVYIITCTANGKVYIGSSNNITLRWKTHIHELKNGQHNASEDFEKYGIMNFRFEILMECDIELAKYKYEGYFMQKYESCNPEKGYNKLDGLFRNPVTKLIKCPVCEKGYKARKKVKDCFYSHETVKEER